MAKPPKPIDAAEELRRVSPALDERYIETQESIARRNQKALRPVFRREPFRLIEAFVACFEFNREGVARLHSRPDDSVIELLAERLRKYLNTAGSLDVAFELKKKTRGRGSAKESARLRLEAFGAQAIYGALRDQGKSQKQAIPEVADILRCTEGKARSLIFPRDRKTKRKNS